MGTTCANLQIIKPASASDRDVIKTIPQAYAKLGYEQIRTADKKADKQAIIVQDGTEKSFALFDSNNVDMDSGELKELAVHISKLLKTTAVVVTIYDSDQFEFVVYASGKQVDAIVSNAEQPTSNLKILPSKSRSKKWLEWFGSSMLLAGPRDHKTTEKEFKNILGTISNTSETFAETTVRKLCELVKIPSALALGKFTDYAKTNSQLDHLKFKRKEGGTSALKASSGQISLKTYLSADDSPYHTLYPASWPILPGKPTSAKWLIVSEGAGFKWCVIQCHLKGASSARLLKIELSALPFYNGQVTSMNKVAHAAWDADSLLSQNTKEYTIKFDQFNMPDIAPESKKQIVLILRAHFISEQPETFTVDITFTPQGDQSINLVLPPLKIAGITPAWLPIVSGLNPRLIVKTLSSDSQEITDKISIEKLKALKEKSLESDKLRKLEKSILLNHGAVVSGVAILADSSAAVLNTVRTYFEGLLSSFKLTPSCELSIHTEKHMTESAYVGKSTKVFSLESLLADKLWPKLFDLDSNYQTVQISIVPQGYDHPIASLSFQAALKDENWQHERNKLFEKLGQMNGEPVKVIPDTEMVSALHVYQWFTNDKETEKLIGLTIDESMRQFNAWMSESNILQAWITTTAQIPIFDLYDEYGQSLYEDANLDNRFHSGFRGKLMYFDWCANKLRFVAPTMWLCETLMKKLEYAKLEHVVNIQQQSNGVYKLELKPQYNLNDMEFVLLPLLPIDKNRLAISEIS